MPGSLAARIARAETRVQRPRTQTASIPSQVFGWNARDNLADMDPRFALVMRNMFPDGNDIRLRQGIRSYATGLPGVVETLHEQVKGESRKLIAFSGGNSYDASSNAAVGAPLATGFQSNRWSAVNAGAAGGETGLYANGVDPPQAYDGTTWSAAGLTGPSNPNHLNGLTVVNKRLWGFEINTGRAWYWPVEAVTGAGASFDIGSVVPAGGNIVAIGSLTLDGGDGLNDKTIFIMQSGAVVVYSGTDPADATNWALNGVWQAGNPIGNRCLVDFGSDVVLITDAGFVSLLRFTQSIGRLERSPLSDNIRNAVNEASLLYEGNWGWQAVYNPHQRQLIFNIPTVEGNRSEQFVMNSFTGAWCSFSDWHAFSFANFNNELYVGLNGQVAKANEGGNDLGEPIRARWQTAWNYLGIRGREKLFTAFRPTFRSNSQISLQSAIGTDFVDPQVQVPSLTEQLIGGKWNVGKWNDAKWGRGLITTSDWIGANNEGFNISFVYETFSKDADIRFLSTDLIYELGSFV